MGERREKGRYPVQIIEIGFKFHILCSVSIQDNERKLSCKDGYSQYHNYEILECSLFAMNKLSLNKTELG